MTPTEDTPNLNKCVKCGTVFYSNEDHECHKQDDKQLREAIDQAIQDHLIIGVDSGQAYFRETDFAVDAILALFNTAQLQLVTELERELPQDLDEWNSQGTMQIENKVFHDTLDTVTTILEHKKQELERGK